MARSILVVEDEIPVARVLERALAQAGYQVVVVTHGMAAIDQLQQRTFDAVLSDICMPRMNGRELCERICAERLGGEPLLFVSSSLGEEDLIRWARSLSRVELAPKPVSVRRLLARLEERFAETERPAGDAL